MKRKHKSVVLFKLFMSGLALVVIVPASTRLYSVFSPTISEFTRRTAIASSMLNMPQGALKLLEQRFNEISDQSVHSDLAASQSSSADPDDQPTQSVQLPAVKPKVESDSGSAPAPIVSEIPKEFEGVLLEENFSIKNAKGYIQFGQGYIKNYTKLTDTEILKILQNPLDLKRIAPVDPTKTGGELIPQVLIVHTHATEAYEPVDRVNYDKRYNWRSTDNTKNMIAVGDALAKSLLEQGIGVIHNTTQHDYPSYNGAYERSAKTINKILEDNPSIQVVLDVHRDAIEREDQVIVKPTVEIDGKKAAQLMIIAGSDDGSMNMPNWKSNFRFAAELQNTIETLYEGLTRPVFFCYRKYNMDLTKGSLLLEFGSHGNTLEENVYTAQMVGKSLAEILNAKQ